MKIKAPLDNLIQIFSKFPGVGRRTAERFAYYILSLPKENANEIINAISNLKDRIRNCKLCNNLSEEEICHICSDSRRDSSLLCVVEEPRDVTAIEKTAVYKGKYFVLLGAINPLEGIGPNDIKIKELIARIKSDNKIREIIIATDADAEGEATGSYIIKQLRPFNRKITRIGFGLPIGANLEYADKQTLTQSLQGRREIVD
jgi:recombination protein RecR